jgi:hypothetical protein
VTLRVIQSGASAWDDEDLADLRAEFERAIEHSDRIAIFSISRLDSGEVAQSFLQIARKTPRTSWMEMLGNLGFQHAKWMHDEIRDHESSEDGES